MRFMCCCKCIVLFILLSFLLSCDKLEISPESGVQDIQLSNKIAQTIKVTFNSAYFDLLNSNQELFINRFNSNAEQIILKNAIFKGAQNTLHKIIGVNITPVLSSVVFSTNSDHFIQLAMRFKPTTVLTQLINEDQICQASILFPESNLILQYSLKQNANKSVKPVLVQQPQFQPKDEIQIIITKCNFEYDSTLNQEIKKWITLGYNDYVNKLPQERVNVIIENSFDFIAGTRFTYPYVYKGQPSSFSFALRTDKESTIINPKLVLIHNNDFFQSSKQDNINENLFDSLDFNFINQDKQPQSCAYEVAVHKKFITEFLSVLNSNGVLQNRNLFTNTFEKSILLKKLPIHSKTFTAIPNQINSIEINGAEVNLKINFDIVFFTDAYGSISHTLVKLFSGKVKCTGTVIINGNGNAVSIKSIDVLSFDSTWLSASDVDFKEMLYNYLKKTSSTLTDIETIFANNRLENRYFNVTGYFIINNELIMCYNNKQLK